jgi:hypothetical protein
MPHTVQRIDVMAPFVVSLRCAESAAARSGFCLEGRCEVCTIRLLVHGSRMRRQEG